MKNDKNNIDILTASAKVSQAIFEHAPIGIEVYNENGELLQVNKKCLEIFGVTDVSYIQGFRLFEDPNISLENRSTIKNGRSISYDVKFDFNHVSSMNLYPTVKSGKIDLSIIIQPIKENESISGFIVLVQDITERKQTEEALRNERSRLANIVEGTNVGTWEWNVQTGETIFNDNWARMLGYTLEELSPVSIKTWETLAHHDDLKNSGDLLERHFTGELPHYDFECRMKHKDGQWIWVHDRGKVVSWTADGKPLMMIGTHADITEHKRTLQSLQSSEQLLRNIIDSSTDYIYVKDRNLRTLICNKTFAAAVGKQPSELVGKTDIENGWDPLFVKGDVENGVRGFETDDLRALGGEIVYVVDEPGNVSNAVRIFDTIKLPLYMNDGEIIGVLGISRDITDRALAVKSLRESEERYRSLFEKMGEAFALHEIVCDHAGTPVDYRFIDVNPAFEKHTGLARKDMIGRNVRDVLPGTENVWIEKYGRVALTGESVCFESYAGSLSRHYYVQAFCPRHGQFAVIFSDITEQKIVQEMIAAEKEQLLVTLRSIGDGVITTDVNGNIVLMNKVAEELTGWKQDEAQGKPLVSVFRIINESTREPHENPVQKVLATGKVIELANHTLLISRDGIERVIADSGAPIQDKKGNTIGVVLVFRDMTEKQIFLEITQNAQKLESLGVLAGGIAHDFNNLLGGIYGCIDIAGESRNHETISRSLSKAMNTIERARDLTRQLLTFAKGGAPVIEANTLFPFVQETVQFALSGANVTCHFDVAHDLWVCNFDKNQIGQIIDNLIINAQQAMPMGGAITIRACNVSFMEKEHPILSKGNYVRLSIEDSGIGMPREMLTKIFDPFFTTKSKGHGLGLATSYSIINRHNGCIDVDSEPGKGSIFHVYLPATEGRVTSYGKKITGRHRGSGTFLVMDDEDVMRDAISDMLESFGYSVVCKTNGKDAIDFFVAETKAHRPISAMIFDLTIPGEMSGKEAIAEIRKLNTEIPVFVASGYTDGPVMKNPVEYGFTASICKPFRRIELMEMLEKHMK